MAKRDACVDLLDLIGRVDQILTSLEGLALEVALTPQDWAGLERVRFGMQGRKARLEQQLADVANQIWEARMASRAREGRGGWRAACVAE